MKAEALVVIENNLGGPEIWSCVHVRVEADVSAPNTTGGSEGTTCVFRELVVWSDEVKTPVKHQRRRCKETKVYETQILGAL